MTDQPQTGTGKTAGLPGANADARTADIIEDERGETVAMGGVAPLDSDGEGDAGR